MKNSVAALSLALALSFPAHAASHADQTGHVAQPGVPLTSEEMSEVTAGSFDVLAALAAAQAPESSLSHAAAHQRTTDDTVKTLERSMSERQIDLAQQTATSGVAMMKSVAVATMLTPVAPMMMMFPGLPLLALTPPPKAPQGH